MNLHVVKLPKNSGTPGMPRNVGMQFARGKYIAFLDSDDLFTKTALEEWTTPAEQYQADVVHNDDYFFFNRRQMPFAKTNEIMDTKNLIVVRKKSGAPLLEQATDEPSDIAGRIRLFLNNEFHYSTGTLFCRRDFVITNQLKFSNAILGEDIFLNFACLCLAKKLVRIPNVTYIYMDNPDSTSRVNLNPEKYFHKWLSSLKTGFITFEKFMKEIPFFTEHPDYRYAVLDWFFNRVFNDAQRFPAYYSQIHVAALNQFVEREFHSDEANFAAYLFNTVNIHRLQLMQLQQENNALRNELKKYQTVQ